MPRIKQSMPYQLRKPKYKWRDFLTEEEGDRVQKIEKSQRPSPAMRLAFETIRNRATQRALRDAAKRSV